MARWSDVRSILIVRLDNLGDVILATPAVRALRRAFPAARLSLLASPVGAPVAALDPDFDDAIVYRAPWMDPDHQLPQDPLRETAMIDQLRREGFDAAIIFTSYHESSLPAAYLCYLAGIRLRHAASVDGPGSLLTSRHRPPNRTLHEVERGLDLVGGLGIDTSADDLVLYPRDADRAAMRARLAPWRRDDRPVVAIHPGCSCPARTYPPERFAAAAAALHRQMGAQIIWTGSPAEAPLIAELRRRLPFPTDSVVGQTDLSQLAALLEACDLVLTNNTGPMHVAAAVHTPTLVFFALTNPPEEWRPWKVQHRLLNAAVPCAICYQRVCPHGQACLTPITPDQVVSAAAALLDQPRSERGR